MTIRWADHLYNSINMTQCNFVKEKIWSHDNLSGRSTINKKGIENRSILISELSKIQEVTKIVSVPISWSIPNSSLKATFTRD